MYAAKLGEFENVRALLIDSTDEQIKRLKHIQSHLLAVCEIIPLTRARWHWLSATATPTIFLLKIPWFTLRS